MGEWEESWDTFTPGEFFLKLEGRHHFTPPGDLKAGVGYRPEYDDAPEMPAHHHRDHHRLL